jgi:hypothetical protein
MVDPILYAGPQGEPGPKRLFGTKPSDQTRAGLTLSEKNLLGAGTQRVPVAPLDLLHKHTRYTGTHRDDRAVGPGSRAASGAWPG